MSRQKQLELRGLVFGPTSLLRATDLIHHNSGDGRWPAVCVCPHLCKEKKINVFPSPEANERLLLTGGVSSLRRPTVCSTRMGARGGTQAGHPEWRVWCRAAPWWTVMPPLLFWRLGEQGDQVDFLRSSSGGETRWLKKSVIGNRIRS